MPPALIATGAILVLRPVLPAVRPFRPARSCSPGAHARLAAGTLGLGPRSGRAVAGSGWRRTARGVGGGSTAHEVIGTSARTSWPSSSSSPGCSCSPARRSPGCSRAPATRVADTTRVRAAGGHRAAPRAAGARTASSQTVRRAGVTAAARRPRGAISTTLADPGGLPDDRPVARTDRPTRAARRGPRGGRRRRAGVTIRPEDLTPQGRLRASITDDPAFQWTRAAPTCSSARAPSRAGRTPPARSETRAQLVEALGHFGVQAKVIGMVAGPHITRYELRLAPGIKMSKVAQLKDDLAYALAATDIRILAPIPGKTAVGVEVPNQRRRIVQLGDVFQDRRPTGRRSRSGSARTSRARRSAPTSRRCRTCSSPARPARASRRASTRCSRASSCARRRTRCGSSSSTPSRSSSTTTSRSRTCSRRSSRARAWPPTRSRTSSRRWRSATRHVARAKTRSLVPSSTACRASAASRRCPTSSASSTSSPT